MSFFNFCSERLTKEAVDADGRCKHFRRVFFYIPANDIKRNRPSRLDICGLPGTRQIHSVCGVGPKQLKVRRLSCFCQGCSSGGECLNSAYVDKWTAKTLKTKRIQDDLVPDDPVADGQDTDDDGADDPVATDPTTETETTDPDNDGPVVDDPGTSGSIGNAPHGDAVSQDVNDVPPLQFQDLDISEIFKVMMRDDPMCPVNESTSDTHPSRADSSLNSADCCFNHLNQCHTRTVIVHLLPVGHTHEDVEQLFSCISRLRSNNAFTLADLEMETRTSCSPPVTVKFVQDFKTVVHEAMAGSYGNHSKPLWFRFRNAGGKCHMHYRMWVTDEWRPTTDSDYPHGLACLKVPVILSYLASLLKFNLGINLAKKVSIVLG
ncbi:hypothetical protein HOLleu_03437 [Holothuria leucospilota]|uniref:DUF7869 domain-containing protein n=1 Tax=Holothuria leucospilota TaxID=206669 RepID=A0A9Q1HLW5_HOLLE|nr:hypothetical protein HOLleu_03437 [Holothuria leucospilota]